MTAELAKDFNDDYTVADLLADTAILGFLSAPESVSARADGETLDGDDLVSEYRVIYLEKAASEKA